jgi:hypothetical protein
VPNIKQLDKLVSAALLQALSNQSPNSPSHLLVVDFLFLVTLISCGFKYRVQDYLLLAVARQGRQSSTLLTC